MPFQFKMNKKERAIWEFEMDFKKSFYWRSSLSNGNMIFLEARPENVSEPGGTPPPRTPGNTPPPPGGTASWLSVSFCF